MHAFLEATAPLGDKLGPLLVQLGPTHQADLPALEAFTRTLPRGVRAAFEFRHASWFTPELLGLLRERGLALCIADGGKVPTPREVTADYAYFRLRDEGYGPGDIKKWAEVIRDRAAACREVFVFFKHEESGVGAQLAAQLREELGPED
jgi:uncharacterized protein YecE (DUF72 family)